MSLHLKILIGMITGVVFGFIMSTINGGTILITNWIKPFGTIFINSLKLIAIPLILASLIKGISDLKDISRLSSMGAKTITTYLFTTICAVSIGLLVVNFIKPGESVSEKTRTELIEAYSSDAAEKRKIARDQKSQGPLQPLIDLVPSNIVGAASSNKNMLQIIFFAILFGISMILIPENKSKPLKLFFDSLNDVVLKIIDLIMLCAPYGVFALLATLVAEAPNADLLTSLLLYSLTLLLGLVILLVFYLILVKLMTGKSPQYFLRGILPAQLVAFSTSSSAATLPVTIKCVQEGLKVPKKVSDFVLPIGATVNMDGTSLYQAVAVIFLAQFHGVDLSMSQQLGIVATTTLASIGSAAVPSAGLIMLMFVLSSVGLNPMWIVIIYPIDRILDMCRTVINVSSDATVAAIVAKTEE